ncbi:MAG: hypothetical protein J1F42_01970 [Lachnospiraceae bacterium]|nr:hypothetical protein [Lachnospiraceae bacterium]
MNVLMMAGLALIAGIVCGIVAAFIIYFAFCEDVQNIVRYLDSIRHEVDVVLDQLSGADK